MKKYLLLFVCLLVTTWASADVTASYNNNILTLTVSGASGQITSGVLDGFTSTTVNGFGGWQYATQVAVTAANGETVSITRDEVANIVAKCVDTNNASVLQQLDLSGMSSLSGSLSGSKCSTLKSLILPKGTSIDGTEFGGNVMITFALSSDGTYYNAMMRNPNGNMSTPIISDGFLNLLKEKAMHLTIVGTVTQDDVLALKDYCKAMYLNMTKATGDHINEIIYTGFAAKLYSIYLPSGMTAIPAQCLLDCKLITNVKIPSGVTSIGSEAFENCKNVTAINLPSGLLTIEKKAFYDCGIQSLRVPESVTTIGYAAFQECKYLRSVVLPSSLKKIGVNAFYNCYYLKDIYLKGDAPSFIDDNGNTVTTGYLMTGEQVSGTTGGFPTDTTDPDPTATRDNYWKAEPQATSTSTNGCTMLHVTSTYAYSYTVKDRYENNNKYSTTSTSTPIYNQFKSSTTDKYTTRYPSQQQLKDIISDGCQGWNAFALVDMNYNPSKDEDVPNITDATWYTLCYPFTMTRAMIEDTFGSGTEVCEFVGVTSSVSGTTDTRTIHFTKDLIVEGLKSDGVTPNTDASAEIIQAGHPYMIHPSVAPTTKTTTSGTTTAYSIRTDYTGYPVAFTESTTRPDAVKGTKESETGYVKDYSFQGNYSAIPMPANVFYLSTYNGNDVYKYRTTPSTKNNFRAFTAVINPPTGTTITGAKMSLAFDEEDSNETTGIQDIQATAASVVTNKYVDKVFNMQGQVVRTGSTSLDGLDKGIYIVNGKKYVVR